MPFRAIFTDAINAQARRRIRARARYNRRVRSRERLSHVSVRTTALIVASALFMEQLDGTVLATALPTMARTFNVDPLQMNVALTAYLLSLAVFIPASGKVADRFGTRTVFRYAIALFTLGSILCGLSNGLWQLVGARVLQGVGGAMMVPVGRLVLLRSVERSELVSAMTWLMIPATIGPVLGPPVGGFLVTTLSWRWIFYINVPIGVLGMVLATLYIRDIKEEGRVDFDGWGLLLSGVSLSCLMFGLELASRGETSWLAAIGIVGVGLGSGALYVHHSRHHPQPVLDFSLMRVPTFGLSVIGGGLTRISGGAVPFLLPMMLQLGFGMSALQSGLITFTSSAGSLMMKGVAKPVLRRWGFRNVMMWNGLTATIFLGVIATFRPSWPLAGIYAALLVGGFFQSLQYTAYNTIAYADIDRTKMSAATSFYTTFQQLMLTLGICTAAAALGGSLAVTGHTHPLLIDYSVAFIVVALVALAAAPTCARLPRDAGDELSGRVSRKRTVQVALAAVKTETADAASIV
ncbi:MFS transporter [Acidisphaera sp. L21]|uniref:MFS transporter n=1 Tax=Acidisphaera sp. L21 TaxID=1641851 RepID=UPI00131B43B6|nr:MFS transporter [Acidisphaera sp. L21]